MKNSYKSTSGSKAECNGQSTPRHFTDKEMRITKEDTLSPVIRDMFIKPREIPFHTRVCLANTGGGVTDMTQTREFLSRCMREVGVGGASSKSV